MTQRSDGDHWLRSQASTSIGFSVSFWGGEWVYGVAHHPPSSPPLSALAKECQMQSRWERLLMQAAGEAWETPRASFIPARSPLTPLSLTNRHSGMKDRILLSAAIIAFLLGTMPGIQAANMPLPRSSPEAQGISSQAICDFVEALDKINTLHSFILVRHGKVIGEGWWKPEAPDKPHVLASLSKSFNAKAVGRAIEDGKLSLDDPVLKFFPADAPADPSDNLKAMTVRDLLTMTCGHETEPKAVGGAPSVKQFLAHPVPHQPGTHFQYNTMGSYTLSAIVTKVTGQTDRKSTRLNS